MQLAVRMGYLIARLEVSGLVAGTVAARRSTAMRSAEAFAACLDCPKGSAPFGTSCSGKPLVDRTPAAAAEHVAAEVLDLSAILVDSGSYFRGSAEVVEIGSETGSTSSERAQQIAIAGSD